MIDTRNQRAAAMGFGLYFLAGMPFADGAPIHVYSAMTLGSYFWPAITAAVTIRQVLLAAPSVAVRFEANRTVTVDMAAAPTITVSLVVP